jgi:hypothetical protein
MTRRWAVLGLMLGLIGCASKPEAPRQLMTPNTRMIYHGGSTGQSLYTFCDRGNRVYQNEMGHFQAIPGGCPDGSP